MMMTIGGYICLIALATSGESLRLNQEIQNEGKADITFQTFDATGGTMKDKACLGTIKRTTKFAAAPEENVCLDGSSVAATVTSTITYFFGCKNMAKVHEPALYNVCTKFWSTAPATCTDISETDDCAVFPGVKKITANECFGPRTVATSATTFADAYFSASFDFDCSHLNAAIKGDPHVTTINGDKLDLVKSGSSHLLNIPRGEQGSKVSLRVQVVVDPVQLAGCTYQFIKEVGVYGQWVNINSKPIHLRFSAGELQKPEPFSVFVDGNQILHAEFLSLRETKMLELVTASAKMDQFSVKVHGSTIDVELVKKPLKDEFRGVQFLNVNVHGLRNMGIPVEYVGGVLGLDREGTGSPAHCQKQNKFRTISTAE